MYLILVVCVRRQENTVEKFVKMNNLIVPLCIFVEKADIVYLFKFTPLEPLHLVLKTMKRVVHRFSQVVKNLSASIVLRNNFRTIRLFQPYLIESKSKWNPLDWK